jgi:N-acetylglutamate synthase-like GNAT family acetyltransferase
LTSGAYASGEITVRRATPQDAERLAELATQLGYPSSAAQVARRLERVLGDARQAVLVAEAAGGVVGWVHIIPTFLIESDPQAEIGGLVVDQDCRRGGVGTLLINQAEHWARAQGLRSIYLRSNVLRREAHRFYEKLGYQAIKTQTAFRKQL